METCPEQTVRAQHAEATAAGQSRFDISHTFPCKLSCGMSPHKVDHTPFTRLLLLLFVQLSK